MLEDHRGDQRIPYRANRVVVTPSAALGFLPLHQRFVGQRLQYQLQTLQIAQRIDGIPLKQLRLWYDRPR